MAKSMGKGKFRPPQLRNRLTDFDEIRSLNLVYTIQLVVKPVEQPVWRPVECLFTRCKRLFNRFDNPLYRVNGTLELSPENHPPCKISFRSDGVGGLGEYPVCHRRVSFLVFLFWSLCHAHRSHRWTDFDDLYVIWRLSDQGCAFWGSRWCASPFRGSNTPKTPILAAWIGVSQPNC